MISQEHTTDRGDAACWAEAVCDTCGSMATTGPGHRQLPGDVALVRETDVFDHRSVPRGLLSAHRVAAKVWGRLVVDGGCVGFRFEDEGHTRHLTVGDSIVIDPDRPHHVELGRDARFHVEFHR